MSTDDVGWFLPWPNSMQRNIKKTSSKAECIDAELVDQMRPHLDQKMCLVGCGYTAKIEEERANGDGRRWGMSFCLSVSTLNGDEEAQVV